MKLILEALILQYSENLEKENKKNKEIWTLVKLKNGKCHVVSPDGRIIKIDEVYTEDA